MHRENSAVLKENPSFHIQIEKFSRNITYFLVYF